MCYGLLLGAFIGDKGANWVVNVELEKGTCALSWQAHLIDATSHPLYHFVNCIPIDSHSTVSSDSFPFLLPN